MDEVRLIDRPVNHGAREEALRLTRRAGEACLRLHDVSDVEALHDFRVAVRRLRTFIRAYDEHLGLGRKVRCGLRRLGRGTNGPRDAEVGLEWVAGRRPSIRGRQRVGLEWLVGRLEAEKNAAYDEVRVRVPLRWIRQEARLRKRLAAPFADDLAAGSFGQAAAVQLERACARLEQRLAEITTIEDESSAHQARIEGKRLRYLLEPIKREVPEARGALRELRSFQDAFGELNDCFMLLRRLTAEVGTAAAERGRRLFEATLFESLEPRALHALRQRNEIPGLIEIARSTLERRRELFQRIDEGYLEGRAGTLLEAVRRVSATLADRGPRPRLQIVKTPTTGSHP